MAYDIKIAQKHLDAWLEAELTIINGQSYTIGNKTLNRANLYHVRENIKYWQNQVELAKKIKNSNGKNRVIRVVPRDL